MKDHKVKSRAGAQGGETFARQDQLGLERLIFFSDAVFAIAITLLALEIRLPADAGSYGDVRLYAQLAGMWQKYLAFIISFLVIGTFWMAHHRKFKLIVRYDGRLMMLNLLLLMVIAFIPFPSSVLSSNPGRTATIFYALSMALAGLMLAAIWAYASWRNRLVDGALTARQRHQQFVAPLSTAAIFLLSIGVAFIDADAAKFSWLLILPVTLYANRQG